MSDVWPRSHTLNRRLYETPGMCQILNESGDSDDDHQHIRNERCHLHTLPTHCQIIRNYADAIIPQSISNAARQLHSLPATVCRRIGSTCARFERMPATLLRHGLTYLAGTTTSTTSTTTTTTATAAMTATLQTTTVIITSASSMRLIECAVVLTLLIVLCACALGVNVLAGSWRFVFRRVWRSRRLWGEPRCCADCDRGLCMRRRPLRRPTLFGEDNDCGWVVARRRRTAMGARRFDGDNWR